MRWHFFCRDTVSPVQYGGAGRLVEIQLARREALWTQVNVSMDSFPPTVHVARERVQQCVYRGKRR